MSAIFISHSSKDNAWAERVATWLTEQGYEGIFLDFDPQVGIPAGRDWEKELYYQLRRCRAVVALCSENFKASEWCISEVAIASNLGKSLFPLQISPCTAPSLLGKAQFTRFTEDPDEGFKRLARGLAEAGLDPKDIFQWDTKRPPYPGLMAFQEKDAPVFFGRGEAIQEGLDRLHNLRRYGGKSLLLVLGASGCGKSSLVRAGIVPRLRRDPENWLVLDPFRPGLDPFAELADALAKAFVAHGTTKPEAPATAEELQRQLEDLHRSSGQREATVVVSIDQFEELLGDGGASAAAGDCQRAERFVAFLREAMQVKFGRLLVLATLRSDFLGAFQCHPKLLGLPFDDLKVGPMEVEGYTQVIEGPAQVAGLSLEPGLSQRLVADTLTADALPLLAFTLRELWEKYGSDGDLTITEYVALGGLECSVKQAADGVIKARTLSPEETQALRRAFFLMTRINEQGQYARIPARWKGMPTDAREVLERFVQARLLISGNESGTIEVAHEALLRTWPTLKDWLDQGRQELEQQSRVRRICQDLNITLARETVRREAFSNLESIADYDPKALQTAAETLVEVLADGQRLPWELLVAARLLGTIADEQAEAALRGLLEREHLREEADLQRGMDMLEVLTTAARSLKQLDWQQRASFADGGRIRSLLVPSAMFNDITISTSLVTIRLLPSPREKGQDAWLEVLAQGVYMTMVGIPAGSFLMGSHPDDAGREKWEGPQHEVRLEGFFLSQTPITLAQWRVVAGWEKVERDLKPDHSESKEANRPVNQVSWFDAMEFCSRLSQRSGHRYTLPSEAQWEYACRAGTATPFHSGESSFQDMRYAIKGIEAIGKMEEKGEVITGSIFNPKNWMPLKNFISSMNEVSDIDPDSCPANAWGLQDMHDHVHEWCLDYWHTNYEGAPEDGSAWLNPEKAKIAQRLTIVHRLLNAMASPRNKEVVPLDQMRVMRGVGYSAKRLFAPPFSSEDRDGNGVGFRVCCLL